MAGSEFCERCQLPAATCEHRGPVQLLADAVALDVGHGQLTYTMVVTDGWVTMVPPCARWADGRPVGWVLRELERRRARVAVLMVAGYWARCLELALESAGQDVGPLIASRYPGRCPTCMRVREAGDLIAWCEDEGAWICADCAA
jgi:hypothetical protein